MRRKPILAAAGLIAIGVLLLIWQWAISPPAAPTAAEATIPSLSEQPPEESIPTDTPAEPAKPETVVVYISGAVRAPDVYQLPASARLKDLVLAAGGLSDDADPENVNLAERLTDGQHIRVPRLGETPPVAEETGPGAADEPTESGGLLNINTASAAELDGLPGIGQSFAERIIEYRTANGPFKSTDDLRNVKGIGPALFAKIAPLITVGP
jgi:competence protein ComEA